MKNNIIENLYDIDNCSSIIWEGFDKKYSYSEIMKKSKQIAYLLSKFNEEYVLVHVDHSVLSLCTIIGIWQLNKIFVPVSVDSPNARINSIKEQLDNFVEIKFNQPKDNSGNIINITHKQIESQEEFSDILTVENGLAYVLFTSGTTGKPKGVKISYKNIMSLFEDTDRLFKFNNNDVWINLHSLAFDFSVWELFGALINKANLVMPNDITLYQIDEIAKLIKKHHVNILNQTPTAFYRLQTYLELNNIDDFKYIIFGGEKLDVNSIRNSFEKYKDTEFINMYGITEITVHATYHKITENDFCNHKISNIGKGIGDSNVFLVDENHNRISNGIGEISVSSGGVSTGYLNNKELTKKCFKQSSNSERSTYFSGDLGEYINDKEINYLGRKDNQIEKNGYRIELDEIKYNLQLHSNVVQCDITYYKEQIIAYIIEKNSSYDDLNVFYTTWLKDKIPDFMIPSRYIPISEIPMTSNGKVDVSFLNEKFFAKMENLDSEGAKFEDWFVVTLANCINIPKDEVKKENNFCDMGVTSMQLIDIYIKIIDNFNVDKEFTIVDLFQYNNINAIMNNFVMKEK